MNLACASTASDTACGQRITAVTEKSARSLPTTPAATASPTVSASSSGTDARPTDAAESSGPDRTVRVERLLTVSLFGHE